MTDQLLYDLIRKELFKKGSCTPNVWQFMIIENNGKKAMFEACLPSRGNIRIRKPVKKQYINEDGQQIFLFDVYKFTNKKELKFDCYIEDIKPVITKEAIAQ
ncbi:hypothetical protein [Bacillus sp. AG4(2022)]|uniref:hypothetical protein n=1 Tax=Bacillus sp. AG4(2022) TaxID=2962594 RepID=UPI002880D68F|nr:hypothetical protein [Bacillus sp. AG4(2022)]MDT0160314.1 hypothetical protein [Bacillus sp. AG4(2022)]